ncbi:hypothetical protein PENSPDRAFT_693952 [Peniophora sp. CONT]|nr:hypothetical protein PENSPDRAFT_693952 [Peniophora sp. CONT]
MSDDAAFFTGVGESMDKQYTHFLVSRDCLKDRTIVVEPLYAGSPHKVLREIHANGKKTEYNALVFGNVGTVKDGTRLGAHGGFSPGKDGKLLTNNSHVKDQVTLKCAGHEHKDMADRWNDQTVGILEVQHRLYGGKDVYAQLRSSQDTWVRDLLKEHTGENANCSTIGGPVFGNEYLIVTSQDMYKMPPSSSSPSTPTRSRKRNADGTAVTADKAASQSQESQDSTESQAEPKVGDLYDASTLPNYTGSPLFVEHTAKAVQLDIRDKDNKLIPPGDLYREMPPDSFVIARVTFHLWVMGNSMSPTMVFKSLKVIKKSTLEPEWPPVPAAPPPPPPTASTSDDVTEEADFLASFSVGAASADQDEDMDDKDAPEPSPPKPKKKARKGANAAAPTAPE